MQANQQMPRPSHLTLQRFVAHNIGGTSVRFKPFKLSNGMVVFAGGSRRIAAMRATLLVSTEFSRNDAPQHVRGAKQAHRGGFGDGESVRARQRFGEITLDRLQSHHLGEAGQHGQAPELVHLTVHLDVEREPAEVAGGVRDARRRARRFAQRHRRLVPPSPAAFDIEAMLDEVHMLGVRHVRVVAPRVAREA